jgi:hypothetical protein
VGASACEKTSAIRCVSGTKSNILLISILELSAVLRPRKMFGEADLIPLCGILSRGLELRGLIGVRTNHNQGNT